MDAIAPVLFARFQNSAPTNTQQNAVSSPPKANMLIFQITSGGVMASTNTTMPMPNVATWLKRETLSSRTSAPFCSARCSHRSLMIAEEDAISSDETVEMDAAMGPTIAMPASHGGSVCAMAMGMMLSTLDVYKRQTPRWSTAATATASTSTPQASA